jgi:hypothetical protein
MSKFKSNIFASGAVIGAAMWIAGAGDYLAHAESPAGAVNAPERIAAGGPGSFADIVARVARGRLYRLVEKPPGRATGR